MRILVVADNPGFRELVGRAVAAAGHGRVVAAVERTDDAASAVAEHRPDVVLMARSQPDHDGVWATRQIKVLFPQVDVVALTRTGDGAAAEAFLAAGATARFDAEDLTGLLGWLAEEHSPP